MREMWRHRGMRLIFTANLISMIGSGMNSAAVIWYILQATHSEVSLGALIALQTLPSMLLLPFTGVLIDREDRRHLMMWLDGARGVIIFGRHAGIHPSRSPLARLPDECPGRHRLLDVLSHGERAHSGADAGRQDARLQLTAAGGAARRLADGGRDCRLRTTTSGWAACLLIDCVSYAVSIACVFYVRKGRVTVSEPEAEPLEHIPEVRSGGALPA
jgi:hypothetical protein